jgi:hypothetical protein
MALGDILRWEKVSGEPIVLDDVRLTPQSRVLSVKFPNGAYVWNRPVSVIVERGARRETVVVPDVTFWTNVVLICTIVLVPILFLIGRKGD